MFGQAKAFVLTITLAGVAVAGHAQTEQGPPVEAGDAEATQASAGLRLRQLEAATAGAVDRVLAGLEDRRLRALIAEVLRRNPQVASLEARARAAEQRAPQVRALPDPMAAVTAFLETPETRVGPQDLVMSLSQRLPWFGKLELREQAALYAAAAARAELEAERLRLVTETRRLYYELGFLDAWQEIVRADRSTLEHYEELARTRYAAGVGLEQAVIKIQAEITKDDTRLLEIGNRRATVVASLNALRDLPQETPVLEVEMPSYREIVLDPQELRSRALSARPEMARAEAEIARTVSQRDLAQKEYSPDVTLGLTYTLVGDREDPAGRAMPPPGNGDDVLGVVAGINLPIWRRKLSAGVEEALEGNRAAREARRAVVTSIDREMGELVQRLSLTWKQLRLFDDVLTIQAEESLASAEAAYAAGTLNALDLLDAERVLLEVRTATARTRADYAVAVARLEGAIAGPLPRSRGNGELP